MKKKIKGAADAIMALAMLAIGCFAIWIMLGGWKWFKSLFEMVVNGG